MSWAAVEGFRKWTAKRKRLLQGLLGLAVEGVAGCVPGGGLAVWSTRIVGEFAKHGVERLADTSAAVPEVKPAGQALPAEQLEQLNGWLASLSSSYAGLLDRLDALVTLPAEESDEQLPALVRQTLSQHTELAREFDARAEEVRRQTLSLARIEERLDEIFHGQKGIGLSLEEIKALILQCAPPPGEWEQLRRVRPEAVRLLNEADEHFLAGRPEEGMNVLLRLFQERGVGQATLCRRLGGAWLGEGKLKEAGQCLRQVAGPDGRPPAALTRTLTSLNSSTTRGSHLPAWRSLPRGFVIEERWRIDSEVGRGGMASVYRALGIDDINRGQVAAIKVPAPGLLDDSASRQRFIQEIQVSQKLSRKHHRAIVETLGNGYVQFAEPHTGRPLYGLVLEFIDGQSLAHWLARRQARSESVTPKEIQTILESVCAALEHAHSQSPPILHRDLKPHNIMVTRDGRIKLMDFGIARVLDDRRQTLTGGVVGTPEYLPPEFLAPNYQPDVRSDVYLTANLLVELLTFHPKGNLEGRSDCPEAWLDLIGDAMNPVMRKRPASIREFRDRLTKPPSGVTQPPSERRRPPESGTARWADAPRSESLQERKQEAQRRAIELANQNEFEAAFKLLSELPPELQDLVFVGKFQLQQRDRVHQAARQMAEKEYKYAAAAALLEKLPERLRDTALLAELCAKRDRWVRLEHDIRQCVHSGRFAGLRGKVQQLLTLEPTNAPMRELYDSLEQEKREIVNSIGMKLVLIEPGVFLMGSPESEAGRHPVEGPQHEVRISRPIYLGIYPVTQREYQAIMGKNPAHFSAANGGGPDHPVERVTWNDAMEFCRVLSSSPAERAAGRTYGLPTEAEWEYACRAGCSSAFHYGDSLSSTQANFDGSQPYRGAPSSSSLGRTSAVGSYPANAFGLFDMHGNVWEWCSDWATDWRNDTYYSISPPADPQGLSYGQYRIIRGGAWCEPAKNCRSAARGSRSPDGRVDWLGFRVVMVLDARTR